MFSTEIQKGSITEMMCMTAFLRLGYNVLVPYSVSKYDFVAEKHGKFIKIQCKTSRKSNTSETFRFNSCSQHGTRSNRKCYNEDDIDYFATIWESICYLIPIREVSSYEKVIRLKPPKNNQTRNIHMAKDYEITTILSKYEG